MRLSDPRAYRLLAAAYYPALTLLVALGSSAVGKPVDVPTVLALLVVTAVAGELVGSALRPQIAAARGAKVVLVAILALAFLTPLVVLPDLLFGLSGLSAGLDFQQKVVALLVATLATALAPPLWAVSAGHVLLLRAAARRSAA